MSVLSGLAPSYTWFLVLRALFGIGMGGEWGVGASLVARDGARRDGAACSPGCCRRAMRSAICSPRSRSCVALSGHAAVDPANAWRYMFFIGGLPALLSLVRAARKVKESEAWHEHRTDWRDLRAVAPSALAALPVSRAAADRDGLHLARHAGHVSDLPAAAAALHVAAGRADAPCCRWSARSSAGWCSATCSDRFGRRRAMIGGALGRRWS